MDLADRRRSLQEFMQHLRLQRQRVGYALDVMEKRIARRRALECEAYEMRVGSGIGTVAYTQQEQPYALSAAAARTRKPSWE